MVTPVEGVKGSTRLHFLGTASGLPTAKRFSQTIVLEEGTGTLTLLDVADGASALLMRQGLEHDRIRTIVISHMHADHHSGLAQVLKTMMHYNRRTPLDIVLPWEGIEPLQKYLEACYLIPEWLGYVVSWRPIARQMTLEPDTILEAFANTHLEPMRQRAEALMVPPSGWCFESYSFVIHVDGRRLAYAGNLERSALELLPYAQGVDILILECAHLQADQLPSDLLELSPKKVLLTHIHPKYDVNGGDTLSAAASAALCSVSIVGEGEVFQL